MNLRSGAVVGAGLVPPRARPAFEEGVGLVMAEWTALALAVENEWGGPYSRDKARELVGYVASWFYGRKEHFPDELEEVLEEALVEDFSVEAQDGSPREVAEALCALHDELASASASAAASALAAASAGGAAAGGAAAAAAAAGAGLPAATPRLQALRARAAKAAASRRASRAAAGGGAGGEDDGSSSSGDEGDEGGEGGDAQMGEAAPPRAAPAHAPRAAPVVDEDGFTAVQGRRRR